MAPACRACLHCTGRGDFPSPLPPCPQRLLLRTLFVLSITALGVAMPFVVPVVGLVGSLCWYPLTIAFPFMCWAKVCKSVRAGRRGGGCHCCTRQRPV